MTNHNKRLLWQIPFLILLIVGTVLIIRQQHNTPYQKCAGAIFGTTYHITYQYDDDLQPELEAKMKEVDNALSMFNKESIISRVNNNQPVALNPMFVEVYQQAQQISEDTDGAFDITVGPLVNAWGFGFKNEQMPTPEQVDSLLKIRSQLDFSAIAKGYGCDVVARTLAAQGIENYMVEIGGEVVTHGSNPQGNPWRIGVTKPTDDSLQTDDSGLQAVLAVTDMAMATSGNYRNFYYQGGRKYAHTIDPRTGYPVQHELLSATVFAPTCAQADAYATAFMVLGMEGAKAVLQRHPEMKGYFIYTDYRGDMAVWHSEGLEINN